MTPQHQRALDQPPAVGPPQPPNPANPPPGPGEAVAAPPGPAVPARTSSASLEADPPRPSPTGLGGGVPAWLGQEGCVGDSVWPDACEAGSAELSLAGGLSPDDGSGPGWPGLERGGSVYGVAGAGFLAGVDEPDRMARAALGYLADPGDPVLGALLRYCTAAQVVAALIAGQHPLAGRPPDADALPGLDRALARWSARISRLPPPGQLAKDLAESRLICPGDSEWPTQLAALGVTAPVGLWLHGQADLRFACLRSVSVVGSRSATGYGLHVATELAATLAERGCAVVSGGAYGIDAAAHRGAMAVGGVTVAVLASGLRYGYPRGHTTLFEAIADQGVLVSELPPDHRPTRPGFLVRNRVIAALSRGTVVVEAALRSGALATAARARDLCRPLMAVPGPVTSAQSAGCHEAVRNWGAVLVTSAADVMDLAFPVGEEPATPRRGPVLPRDALDEVTRAVLEAVPARRGAGPAAIAVAAGAGLDTVIQCLGSLAAAGFIYRSPHGWRARRDP
jgi:DNA processing protein